MRRKHRKQVSRRSSRGVRRKTEEQGSTRRKEMGRTNDTFSSLTRDVRSSDDIRAVDSRSSDATSTRARKEVRRWKGNESARAREQESERVEIKTRTTELDSLQVLLDVDAAENLPERTSLLSNRANLPTDEVVLLLGLRSLSIRSGRDVRVGLTTVTDRAVAICNGNGPSGIDLLEGRMKVSRGSERRESSREEGLTQVCQEREEREGQRKSVRGLKRANRWIFLL